MKEKKDIEIFNRELLAKYLANEVNPTEKSEVETWLDRSAENRKELGQTRKMLADIDFYYKTRSYDSNDAWNKVMTRTSQQQLTYIRHKKFRKEVLIRFYKYAAIIVFAVLLGTAGFYLGFRNKTTEVYSEIISVQNQVLQEYTLPDGSVVTLNSNSKLVFPKNFKGETREVTIHGEAFFDVMPNPEKPFIINAGNALVKVVGTSFTVSAYPENEKVEVVVKTGKVQVTNKNIPAHSGVNQIDLEPGEKGTLFNRDNILEKSENTDLNYLSWKTHDFVFNEMPLVEVFNCLEKTYHVTILVSDQGLNDLKLNAQFDKKPVDFILNVVRLTFNLELSVEENQYTFSSQNNNK